MSTTESPTGRYRQRRRTRAAIVNAAAELLRSGNTTPGVNEIAEAADVSRRTVYQYFPTVEQLLLDATLGLLSQAAVDNAIDEADSGGNAVDRVNAMVRALAGVAAQTMPLGRSLIRLTVDAPGENTAQPRRGYRRVEWIERAIEPLRADLGDAGFERLVSALAMVVGWEALIVLQDLRGLSPEEQADVSAWAARTRPGRPGRPLAGRFVAARQASAVRLGSVTERERWLDAVWPFVHGWLPAAPARVVDIGCGPLGGFVPRLEGSGYEATGIDPKAPQGPSYRQAEFEDSGVAGPVDAIIASLSLHHVADLGAVLDQVHATLVPGGVAVVVEWARERFDESTARWCFDRLPEPGDDPGWLHGQRAEWRESGLPWEDWLRSWAQAEGLHTGQDILTGLDGRFDRETLGFGPYFFADLAATSEADEQAAIDAGLIQANRIQYTGRRGDR